MSSKSIKYIIKIKVHCHICEKMCATDKLTFLLSNRLSIDFGYRHKLLADRLLSQGYEVKCLKNSLKRFYGRYSDLIRKYQRSVKDMMADSFPNSFYAVVSLVLNCPFLYWFCHLDRHFLSTDGGCVGCHAWG